MALLRLIKGLSPGKTYPVHGGSHILGRGQDCDIHLDVAAVSRKHARIYKQDDHYVLEDLKSRNGTMVNNRPVADSVTLNHRDRIQICSIVMFFYDDGKENEAGGYEALQAHIDDSEASGAAKSSFIASYDMVKNRGQAGMTSAPAEEKLKALVAIGRHLGEAVQLEEVLLRILESLFDIFPQADRGIIILRDPKTGRLLPKALKQRNPNNEEVRLSRTILQNVITSGKAILSADAAADSRFDMAQSISYSPIRSMMCAPLIGIDGSAIGVLQIDAASTMKQFTSSDLEILASVATQAALAVRSAQLMEKAMEEASLKRELSVAHKVQQGLLPASKPVLAGYQFFDYYAPARHLGGDYYDYIPLPDGRLAVTLADVSGKGISASLLMAKLSAEARYKLAIHPDVTEAMYELNNTFCDERWDDRFVTLVMGIIDPVANTVTMVNAGHVPPVVCHAGGGTTVLTNTERGLPIGVLPDTIYKTTTVTIASGETLFFFTDGATDAVNEQGEMFGADRIYRCWAAKFDSVEEQGMALIRSIERFVGTVPNADDICITGIRRV
ncbi:MAG: SpoIIE family protein phosphatase [Planctomycetia bacterium]|nr:SpoIIE family protein phosphatase [Planctomycetia bacterium]